MSSNSPSLPFLDLPEGWTRSVAKSAVARPADMDGDFDLDGLLAFFRALYPVKPIEHVAAEGNFPVGSVKNWFERSARPRAQHLARIMVVWGMPAIVAMLREPPADFIATAREQRRNELLAAVLRQ